MRILVTGASGQLGCYLVEQLVADKIPIEAWSGSQTGWVAGVPLRPVDLHDLNHVSAALDEQDPAAIIHAAALSSAEAVRLNPELARRINVEATAFLASWCEQRGRRLVYTSTDLVFDGSRSWYREEDPADPILAYGRSKRDAEPHVLSTSGGVVARISLLFGPSKSPTSGFFDRSIATISQGSTLSFFEDEFRTPLHYRNAAEALVRLALSDFSGLVHVAGRERLSRFDLMVRAVEAIGLDSRLVRANRQKDVALAEARPADVSLATDRLARLFPNLRRPTVEESLAAHS
jgi:dTDP-4-dehydrorhamnose reductase